MTTHLYRVIEIRDRLVLEAYPVLSKTKCCHWIDVEGLRKFVNANCEKQYAYTNRMDAYRSFRIRKQRQLEHISRQLAKCTHINELLKEGIQMPIEGKPTRIPVRVVPMPTLTPRGR